MNTPTPRVAATAALDRFLRDAEADAVLAPAVAGLAVARGDARFANLEPELTATLQLLDDLDLDLSTRAAYVLHALRQHGLGAEVPAGAGAVLRDLLDGQQAAEKVGELHQAHAGNAEGLRRLLLAIIRDLRVVFILLARSLARLRAADRLDEAQRRAQAQLTVDLFAPLANRLGIWQLKWELEDLAFRYLQPDTYRRIVRLVDERQGDRDTFIATTTRVLRAALAEAGIVADIAGRPKHFYSIWKKMQRKGGDFYSLYDIRALRVLVDDVAACYAALGIVHSLWPPIPSEFDDYIARPKGNHYQSLHTAVIGPQGKNLEVQIRTHDMHAFAERGVAAHWRYKEATAAASPTRTRPGRSSASTRTRDSGRTHGAGSAGGGDESFERKIAWMRQLLDARDDHDDESALVAAFRTDAVEERVYLLTPTGEVMDLPRDATVLDFAYAVHTDVGHRCRGAKVNGRIVPLNFQPASGDRVEILTGKIAQPRRDWMSAQHGFLTTHRALAKVRTWFRRIDHDANVTAGRDILERELRRMALHNVELDSLPAKFQLKTLDDLLVALALGEITPGHVARMLHETPGSPTPPRVIPATRPKRRAKDPVVIDGVGNLLTSIARCCQPLPGDPIVGYITRGKGVSIHRADCASFARLAARDATRAIPVEWGDAGGQTYDVDIVVRGYDRKGLHKDVTHVIATANINILAVNARVDSASALVTMDFRVRVTDYEHLSTLLGRLAAIPQVIEARRVV